WTLPADWPKVSFRPGRILGPRSASVQGIVLRAGRDAVDRAPVVRSGQVLVPPWKEHGPVHIEHAGALAIVGERPHDRPPGLCSMDLPRVDLLVRPGHREQTKLVSRREDVVVRAEVDGEAREDEALGLLELRHQLRSGGARPVQSPRQQTNGLIAFLVGPVGRPAGHGREGRTKGAYPGDRLGPAGPRVGGASNGPGLDRKSTRLNSSHVAISYAVFCLKKKNRWRH